MCVCVCVVCMLSVSVLSCICVCVRLAFLLGGGGLSFIWGVRFLVVCVECLLLRCVLKIAMQYIVWCVRVCVCCLCFLSMLQVCVFGCLLSRFVCLYGYVIIHCASVLLIYVVFLFAVVLLAVPVLCRCLLWSLFLFFFLWLGPSQKLCVFVRVLFWSTCCSFLVAIGCRFFANRGMS